MQAEQIQGNRLRCQVGAQVQQHDRGRVLLADPLQGDVPQRGDRLIAPADLAPDEKILSPAAQQAQIVLGRHRRLIRYAAACSSASGS